MWPFSKKTKQLTPTTIPIETQLAELRRAGIFVDSGVQVEDLCAWESRAELEAKPYAGLIPALGIDLEREPYTPVSNRLWLCDYECIEDSGAYVEVLERLEHLTDKALGLTNIEDHIDFETEEAWLSFVHGGRTIRWDLTFENDWLDPTVFVQYDRLLELSASSFRLYSNHTDFGQSALLGAFSVEEKKVFDALSKVNLPLIADQAG